MPQAFGMQAQAILDTPEALALHKVEAKMPKNRGYLRIFRGDICYRFFSGPLNWAFASQVFPRVRKMTPNPQISLIFWHFYLKTVQRPSETPGVPYTPMNDRTKQLEMTDADFLGYAPEELACNQCGGAFCGLRVGRVYQGKPLIMCSRKDAVQDILAHLSRR